MPLGGLEIDSIRLKESKEYRFSQSQALATIGKDKRYLSGLRSDSPDKVQTLTDKGFTWVGVTVKYHDGKQYRTAKTLSLSDVTVLWFCEMLWGNATASEYALLLMQDSLADRCDQVWGESRSKEDRQERDHRFMNVPEPWTLMFDREVEKHLARLSGFHKNDIRNGKIYWEFFYQWLTPEERIEMDANNPVLKKGRRQFKVHQFLSAEAKDRMKDQIRAVLVLMKTARNIQHWRQLMDTYEGFDQMDFDFEYEESA